MAEVAKALQAALAGDRRGDAGGVRQPDGRQEPGSRLGFLLDRLGHPLAGDDLLRSASPVKLDPSRPANGQVDSLWRINVNLTDAELFPEGVG